MPRVLVIEDNPASLDLMVYLLKAFGHEVLTARDGLEGIETARREQPDLILCDIQLPGADGITVCQELKTDRGLKQVPIIAVTAYAMVGDREKLLAHGFDGYLSKPIQPQSFLEQLRPYLPEVAPAAPESSPIDQSTASQPDGLRGSGTILVVDNTPANILLSRAVLESYGYEIIAAKTVDEAMKLLAISRPDLILSDLHMPDKDGIDFLKAVTADEKFREIPFVMTSATLWAEGERARALSLGAAAFIVRPVEPDALVRQIESCRKEGKVAI